MKKAIIFSLFMFAFGYSATAQLGPTPGSNAPSLFRGMQVMQDFDNQTLTIITTTNIVSLEIRNSNGEVVWTGTGGLNRLETSKWEEGDYYVVVVYPSGVREFKMIKIG